MFVFSFGLDLDASICSLLLKDSCGGVSVLWNAVNARPGASAA